jgi:hypothetical protein
LSRYIAALEAATANLELMGPVRITRIGSTEAKVAVPPQIRERINRLQDSVAAGSEVYRAAVNRKGNGHDRSHDQR